MSKEQFNVLDLFSGAGGLTEGFCRNKKYNLIAHVEMNQYAAKTLETRMLFHALKQKGKMRIYDEYMQQFGGKNARNDFIEKCADLSIENPSVLNYELSDASREEIAQRVNDRLNGEKIDVIIGGPPCQAYSTIGRWSQSTELSDPRLYLYMQYMFCLKKFRPRAFVFENVPGLISMQSGVFKENIQQSMKNAGYNIKMYCLNASDFGVVQCRKRIIFIGWRKEETFQIPEFKPANFTGTIRELLMADLPILDAGFGEVRQDYRAPTNEYLIKSKIRSKHQNILLQHVARPTNEHDKKIYRLAIEAMNMGKRIKYTDIPKKLRTQKNETSFLDRFKVLDLDGLSHSMVAHISKDGNYYIHPDINHLRSLTVREAARIQSFPDNFIFEGPRSAQFVQIGNAVPPLMAEGIAKELLRSLQ